MIAMRVMVTTMNDLELYGQGHLWTKLSGMIHLTHASAPQIDRQWNILLSHSSSSSLTAFHTLISVAMLPYNQSFIVSFVVVVFPLLWVRCGKRKEEKVEEKGGHFTVEKEVKKITGSKIVRNHVNQLRNCSKSATGTGREPYLPEWTAIYVLSPLVPIQVSDTDLLQLAF